MCLDEVKLGSESQVPTVTSPRPLWRRVGVRGDILGDILEVSAGVCRVLYLFPGRPGALPVLTGTCLTGYRRQAVCMRSR